MRQVFSLATMLAAIRAVCTWTIYFLRQEVEEVLYVIAPEPFEGVGRWYEDFSQTTEEEVRSLLKNAGKTISRNQKSLRLFTSGSFFVN
jgi:predicted phosphoribosyltransferase